MEYDGLQEVPVPTNDLDRLAIHNNVDAEMRNAHPLILIVPSLAFQIFVDDQVVQIGSQIFCAAPRDVQIRVGLKKYTIYIEKRAHEDACARVALIQHARLHLDMDNESILKFITEIKDPLLEELKQLKKSPSGNEGTALEKFKKGVSIFLLQATAGFSQERPQFHAKIDAPSEISNLRAACNGRIKSLEDEESVPGRETSLIFWHEVTLRDPVS